jgi:4-amino-4-deoxychorismate lyase
MRGPDGRADRAWPPDGPRDRGPVVTSQPRPLAVAVLGRGIIDPDLPVLHADDRGVLRGLAAFETLRVYGGRPFALPEHLERLRLSAERMHLPLPDLGALEALAGEALTAAGITEATMRFTVTGGREGSGPVAMVLIGAVPDDLETLRASGIGVISLQLGTDPRARRDAPWLLDGVKSTSYAVNMAAHDEAERRGAGDAIFVASEGSVLEGPTTNVWWRRGTMLFTPALDLGILAGVTRAHVLRLASTAGFATIEGWYPLEDMAHADEAFTSSSIRELMPIVRLDGRPIGDGRPGPAAATLLAALREAARA